MNSRIKSLLAVLVVASLTTTACLKNNVRHVAPIVMPEEQSAIIDSFIRVSGFSNMKNNLRVNDADWGVMYEILNQGDTSKMPGNEKRFISAKYVAKVIFAEKAFDSTDKSEFFPIVGFDDNGIPRYAVFPAFYHMITKIGVGGRVRFVTPSFYAYRNSYSALIPPNSPLFFDVELLDISDDPKVLPPR